MSEAPERPAVARQFIVDDEGVFRYGTYGVREGDTVLVTGGLYQDALRRLDLYESERALNAELVEALKAVREAAFAGTVGVYDQVHAALAKAEAREKPAQAENETKG